MIIIINEELKQKISAKGQKIKRYSQRVRQFKEKQTFNNVQRQFFGLLTKEQRSNQAANQREAMTFWSEI